jgi:uncharacterized protein
MENIMNRNKLFIDINKSMVDLFGNKLRKIILYGSYAQNAQNKDSDIDFFVLVDDTEENLRNSKYQIADIMTQLSLNYDILVSITEETYNRYKEYSEFLPFYKNISKEGLEIYGKQTA